jgi:hypothetical protein
MRGFFFYYSIKKVKSQKNINNSHVLDPFTEADERFLEFVNEEIARLY